MVDPPVLRTNLLFHFLELVLQLVDLLLEQIALTDDLLVFSLEVSDEVLLGCDLSLQSPILIGELTDFFPLVADHILQGRD